MKLGKPLVSSTIGDFRTGGWEKQRVKDIFTAVSSGV